MQEENEARRQKEAAVVQALKKELHSQRQRHNLALAAAVAEHSKELREQQERHQKELEERVAILEAEFRQKLQGENTRLR